MRKKLALMLWSGLLWLSFPVTGQVNADPELAALQAIYDLTNGPAWFYSYRWNKQHLDDALSPADLVPSEFPGVRIVDGHVTQIVLSSNTNIRGTLPDASVLNGLSFVTDFSIAGDADNYSYHNRIGGVLPDMSGMTSLKRINFNFNEFTGDMNWATSLQLNSLDLSRYNGAPGTLRFDINQVNFSQWNTLTNLTLSYVVLSGSFDPSIALVDALTYMSLQSCSLTAGSFSPEFGDMASLYSLGLAFNPIINLPSCFGNLSNLDNLSLYGCSLATLPNEFNQLDLLTTLNLGNNGLSSTSPVAIFSNMIDIMKGCYRLNSLSVRSNSLTDVPANFPQLTALRTLDFSFNPVQQSDMNNLIGSAITDLYCRHCQFTNHLPSAWTQLPPSMNLTSVDISNEPQAAGMTNLIDLNAAGVSEVLKNMTTLKNFTATTYSIAQGPLPAWFGTSSTSAWTSVDLHSNMVQLPFPDNIAQMTKLTTLNLGANSLSGVLVTPTTVSGQAFDFSSLTDLAYIYLNDNNLVSPLPGFSGCTKLNTLDLRNNEFSGDFPDYFREGQLTVFRSLDIANNSFVKVPNLSSRPNGASLQLNLSNNFFDFEDLEPYFAGPGQARSSMQWTPQKAQVIGPQLTYYAVEGTSNFKMTYAAAGSKNLYLWQRFNGNTWVNVTASSSANPYVIPSVSEYDYGTYRTYVINEWVTGLSFISNNIQLNPIPALCKTPIANKSGVFKMDKLTGAVVFDRNDCSTDIPVICIYGPAKGMDNVVAAQAVTYSDEWSYTYLGVTPSVNPFLSGEKGKWRTQASYAADASVIQSNDKNYNAGTFRYTPFNWKSGERSAYPGWLLSSKVEKYSPDGEAVEERNAINIPSTAKFGYGGSVPYLIAQNAEYNSVVFESFENKYGTAFEDGFPSGSGVQDIAAAHSGKASLKLSGPTTLQVKTINLNSQIKNNGVLSRMWIKGAGSIPPSLSITGAVNATQVAHLISRSGEWALYEAVIEPAVFNASSVNTSFSMSIQHSGAETIWMDDLRIQPTNAELTAYVYDVSSLRLLTVFDDQHFGLFYQYSAEGKLTRKIIETEKGLKTLQETLYNTPKVNKPNGN